MNIPTIANSNLLLGDRQIRNYRCGIRQTSLQRGDFWRNPLRLVRVYLPFALVLFLVAVSATTDDASDIFPNEVALWNELSDDDFIALAASFGLGHVASNQWSTRNHLLPKILDMIDETDKESVKDAIQFLGRAMFHSDEHFAAKCRNLLYSKACSGGNFQQAAEKEIAKIDESLRPWFKVYWFSVKWSLC